MGLWITQTDQQPIAQILGDVPVKALNDLGPGGLVSPHRLAQIFRVQLCGEGGRIDEVTKQHRELAAFGLGPRAFGCWRRHPRGLSFRRMSLWIPRSGLGSPWLPAQRSATGATDLEAWRILTPTLRAPVLEGRATFPVKRRLLQVVKITAWATHKYPHLRRSASNRLTCEGGNCQRRPPTPWGRTDCLCLRPSPMSRKITDGSQRHTRPAENWGECWPDTPHPPATAQKTGGAMVR
jgi:hypothetical protein